jgi:ketosteroid isomerase-like protein
MRAFVLLLLAGCTTDTVARPVNPYVDRASLEPRPPPPDAGAKQTPTDMERAAADAYTLGVASAGFAKLRTALDEDAHFAFAGYKDVHGRDLVVKAHMNLFGAIDQRSFVTTRVLLTDASQSLEWTMSGIDRASKKPVSIRGLSLLWTRDDGSISDVHVYFDEAILKAQLGAGPKGVQAPPAAAPPKGERQELVQANVPEEQANVAVVRASLDALEGGDEAAYLGTMADDIEVMGLESTQPLRGKTDLRAYYRAMRKSIGNLDTQIDNVWGIGSFVVVEYHIVGEQRGPIGWIPAQKDNLLKLFLVDVVELASGKIRRVWRYDNPSQILSTPDEVRK